MEFSHVFYKKFPVDEDNIFFSKPYRDNEVEQIKFKKSKICAVSGLSIDQDIQSNVSLPNTEGEKAISDILRTYAQEKEKINLDLKNYKENFFDITVPFQKRTDIFINRLEYYDTTTQKQETTEFYNYHYHLRNFGFTWEHAPLEFKYEIIFSADEKTLTKKLAMGSFIRHRIAVDESRIIYTKNKNQAVTISSKYTLEILSYFNIKKPGQVKYLRNFSGLYREKLKHQFNV